MRDFISFITPRYTVWRYRDREATNESAFYELNSGAHDVMNEAMAGIEKSVNNCSNYYGHLHNEWTDTLDSNLINMREYSVFLHDNFEYLN